MGRKIFAEVVAIGTAGMVTVGPAKTEQATQSIDRFTGEGGRATKRATCNQQQSS